MEQSQAPVRVQAEDGSWDDVDLDLVQQADGSYAPKVSPEDVLIGGGGSTLIARVALEDGSSLQFLWPEVLPAPTVSGAVARFSLSENMDLVAMMTGAGVSVRIRFNAVPSAAERDLALNLKSQGVRVSEAAGGTLQVKDEQGEVVTRSGGLIGWDARKDAAGDPLKLVPLSAELSTVAGGGLAATQELSLQTPAGFLDDPATVYPVVLDPDVTANLTSVKDTYVRYGEAFSHGSLWGMDLGPEADDPNPARAFLQFNTSALAGKEISNATLTLAQYAANTCANRAMKIAPMGSAWSEAMWAASENGGEPTNVLAADNVTVSTCADTPDAPPPLWSRPT